MDTTLTVLALKYAQGNSGAMQFLVELLTYTPLDLQVPIAMKIEEIPSLRGTNLYVLWSDLCNRDMFKTALLCESCPNEVLEDACSRQDYSGRELIKPYL